MSEKFKVHIKEYSSGQAEEWDSVVKKLCNYDVFYLNGYVKAFEQENPVNGEPILLVYDNGEDYAINVVFRRDIGKVSEFAEKIREGKYFDLISPYGYGGFIGKISDYGTLDLVYEEYCREKGYVSEFVRFELFSEYSKHYADKDGYVESRTHNVIRNLQIPLDEIWMDFKHKVRKNVKKAKRNGLQIIIDETGEYLDDFISVYYDTMQRTHAEKTFFFSKNFFKKINEMSGNFAYFYVKFEDRIISAELVIYGAENCYSYLGGTDQAYFEIRPNDFLKYEVIKWAKEKGMKNYVLGGGYGSDDGIFQYKTCLAPGGIVPFYIGKKILDFDVYDELCKIRGIKPHSDNIDEIDFFPEYREGD
jgi:hypothetical protein